MRRTILFAAAASLAAACGESTTSPYPLTSASDHRSANRTGDATQGAVFTETNAIAGNAVVAFARATDGSLTYAGTFSTGGRGIGGTSDPLASQFSLVLGGDDNRLLFVANAGSNDVSTFRVDGANLSLVGTTSTGGTLPVSLAVAHRTLYVLNAASNSVSGFDIGNDGTLSAKSEASSPLGAGANGGAAVRVSPDGNWLVVTEKGSNTIDVFPVSGTGALGSPVRSGSSGLAPFGFDFVNGDQLVVSEAGSGASSLYDIAAGGRLNTESASVSTNGGVATCWLIATTDGRFAFAVNAGSGTISGYRIGVRGMTLLDASGVSANTGLGSNPLDLDLSSGDRYLYVLENGTGRIGAFAVGADGALSPLAGIGGLPANSGLQGIAAY